MFYLSKAQNRKELEKKIEVKKVEESKKIAEERKRLEREKNLQMRAIRILEDKIALTENVNLVLIWIQTVLFFVFC